MSTEDGGAAFPGPFSGHCGKPDHMAPCDCYVDKGMTLRDWFAGQVINRVARLGTPIDYKVHAKEAYKIADAMISARAVQKAD